MELSLFCGLNKLRYMFGLSKMV